jgi:hypothetical protein
MLGSIDIAVLLKLTLSRVAESSFQKPGSDLHVASSEDDIRSRQGLSLPKFLDPCYRQGCEMLDGDVEQGREVRRRA